MGEDLRWREESVIIYIYIYYDWAQFMPKITVKYNFLCRSTGPPIQDVAQRPMPGSFHQNQREPKKSDIFK